MSDIAVVMLTCKQQKDLTLQCLESFESVNLDKVNLLVWDNGSTDDTVTAIRHRFPHVEVCVSEKNLGAAGGRNAGSKAAIALWDPKFLMFLDNDTKVTPDFIEKLLKPFDNRPDIAITTPKIRFLYDPERIDAAGGSDVNFYLGKTPAVGTGELDKGQYDEPRECTPGSCCILVRVSAFERVGGFDTAFDPYGFEDIDFTFSVKEAGYKCMYVPESLIFHAESQTFEDGQYTSTYANRKAINWYRFVKKHASPLEKAGFWFIGVPFRLLSAVMREAKKGNVAAITGLISGGMKALSGRTKEPEQ